MIVHWMRVGFVHGVMNTDNMSILGLTIDYGPYGWLEDYDPDWTPNTTDAGGRRYRFGYQPRIAQWNLLQLANALAPLVEEVEPLQQALGAFSANYEQKWHQMMAQKLGLRAFDPATDPQLITDLLEVLRLVETDMTIFFRQLATIDAAEAETTAAGVTDRALVEPLTAAYYEPEELGEDTVGRTAAWMRRYRQRLRRDGTADEERRRAMNAVNPKYVLRNYLAQLAIDRAEEGDFSMVNELLELLRHPYEEQPSQEQFAARRPEWARHRVGCSMLSCSS